MQNPIMLVLHVIVILTSLFAVAVFLTLNEWWLVGAVLAFNICCSIVLPRYYLY